MLITIYSFVNLHGGIIDKMFSTTDEKQINIKEQKWLMEYKFLRPGMTVQEAIDEYRDSGCDDDYRIFNHVLKITAETEIIQTTELSKKEDTYETFHWICDACGNTFPTKNEKYSYPVDKGFHETVDVCLNCLIKIKNDEVGVKMGSYTHTVMSAHIIEENDMDFMKKMMKK